jgi:hypothetical protein
LTAETAPMRNASFSDAPSLARFAVNSSALNFLAENVLTGVDSLKIFGVSRPCGECLLICGVFLFHYIKHAVTRWMYQRIAKHIIEFEKTLRSKEEVGGRFVSAPREGVFWRHGRAGGWLAETSVCLKEASLSSEKPLIWARLWLFSDSILRGGIVEFRAETGGVSRGVRGVASLWTSDIVAIGNGLRRAEHKHS